MKPTPVPSPSSLLRGTLVLAAIALAPAAAFASTAANTVINNTASVSYNDAGGAAQTPVTASASVTVTLVPSAVAITSPANQIIGQGTSATLTYTVTATANGPDTYNLTSSATPSSVTAVTPAFPANITLGGTTLAADTISGTNTITVPSDSIAGAPAIVNGIAVNSHVMIGANEYVVASVTKNAATNTATIGLTTNIIGATVTAGQIVGERKTFTETVASGTVTSGSSGTQTVSTTATSATSAGATATQATPTVITVNRPTMTVTKLVSTDGGVTFGASGSAAPGTTLIYKITASNTGATSASQVAFTDVIPAYLSYVATSGKVATSSATAYSAATALTEGSGGYSYTAGTTTVAYNPGAATGTVAGGGVLVLFFEAKIN
jgi:uncharacterized repeat protein (TIGR01451 family)